MSLRGFYFCFYSVLIIVMGLSEDQKRKISFPSLTILCLIALIGLFVHSLEIYEASITLQYLNFYLMFEGFIYILCGAALFTTLVQKATNLRLFYITIPIALIPAAREFIYSGRGSVVFAVALAVMIYMLIKKRYLLVALAGTITGAFLLKNLAWFKMKFACRIPLWKDMFLDALKHPFIGDGFNKLLTPDNMTISMSWGKTWLFKHNDYLNIIGVLGFVALIPIVLFIVKIFSIVRTSWFSVGVMAILILCFVQMTIFSGDRALAIVAFLALAVTENERGIT